MQFVEAKTWPERGQQFQCVKDKCNAVVAALGLPETDARAQGMIHVRQACNTLAAVPMRLQQCAEVRRNRPVLLRLLGLQSEPDLENVLNDLNSNAKASFLTVVQFALEHSAKQVVRAVAGPAPDGFKPLAKRLVRISALPNPARKVEIMCLPAYLRNTLHSNGLHSHPSVTITVGGEPYVFTQNQRVACSSWSHLFVAVYHSLYVYEEAYLSPTVASVPSIPAA